MWRFINAAIIVRSSNEFAQENTYSCVVRDVSVLRGHCAYYGMPHNWRALAGFRQALRRIWFTCLKRRSQRSRRAGWDWFEAVTARYPLPPVRITRSWPEQRIWRV